MALRNGRLLWAIFAGMILIGGCAQRPAEDRVSAGSVSGDAALRVKAGQSFTIVLASNPTTGYRWTLARSPGANVVTSEGSRYIPPSSSIPGKGGREEWKFKAQRPGQTTLEFHYLRPWEKGEAVKRVTYTITVR
jgi:inhibitor of cysteine peptidase